MLAGEWVGKNKLGDSLTTLARRPTIFSSSRAFLGSYRSWLLRFTDDSAL